MKRYIRASLTSGLVGIWWIKDDVVIADAVDLDSGYNDGNFIHYDEVRNHTTEWSRLIREYFPDDADTIIRKGYKSIDRGRVVYNLRTQCYANPLPVGFRSGSDIHSHIKYFTVSNTDKLPLCMVLLKMDGIKYKQRWCYAYINAVLLCKSL